MIHRMTHIYVYVCVDRAIYIAYGDVNRETHRRDTDIKGKQGKFVCTCRKLVLFREGMCWGGECVQVEALAWH